MGPTLIWCSVGLTLTLWMGSKVARQDWFLHTSLYGSKTCALTAMTLMGWLILLATRSGWLERLFDGIDHLYAWHRRLGVLVAILLTLHPLFLAAPRLPHLGAYLSYLFVPFPHPTTAYQVGGNVGAITFWTMMVLLILAHQLTRPYQKWLQRHQWMGAVYLLAMLHVGLVNRDIALYPALTVWMWGWIGLGAVSWLAIRCSRWWAPQRRYRVRHVEMAQELITLQMLPESEPLLFQPGQWALFEIDGVGQRGERHPLSIACAPRADGRLTVGARIVGPWTAGLQEVEKGTTVTVYGPYGVLGNPFLLAEEDVVCIGGGIGITPFLGMWEYALHEGKRRKQDPVESLSRSEEQVGDRTMQLFYLVKDPQEAVFDGWIRQTAIASRFYCEEGALQTHHYEMLLSPVHNPISLAEIAKRAGGLQGKKILLCGPIGMIRAYLEQAHMMLIPSQQIAWEAFEWRRD
jgi:predicted ferric reductase